jgi:hypothetical protein
MESLTQLVDESTLPQELPSDEAAPSTPSTAAEEPEPEQQPMERGLAFWLVFISLCTCSLLSALEFVRLIFLILSNVHADHCTTNKFRRRYQRLYQQSFTSSMATTLFGLGAHLLSHVPRSCQPLAGSQTSGDEKFQWLALLSYLSLDLLFVEPLRI